MAADQWWHTPLIAALGKQRQVDFCEFKASLLYKVSSRTSQGCFTEKPCLKNKQTNKNTIYYGYYLSIYIQC